MSTTGTTAAAAKQVTIHKIVSAVAPTAVAASFALTPWSVLTATAGLVAFHIGLFTLVGRERKSPYIINLIFPIFITCLIAATLALIAAFAMAVNQPQAADVLVLAATAVLIAAFILSIAAVYRIATRFIYFVDGIRFRQLPGIRQLRRAFEMNKPTTYAHNPLQISDEVLAKIRAALGSKWDENLLGTRASEFFSLAIRVRNHEQSADILTPLCVAFLEAGYSIQYLAAARHPIEFLDILHNAFGAKNWSNFANRIVVVDGYSPHFAFLDSIYLRKDRELKALGVERISSSMTYAGLHSASSKAFNVIAERTKDPVRKPTLVIYDGCYSLTDLESSEQYRVFVRHVLPSERMWGGMLTVFTEAALPTPDWNLLESYADIAVDMTRDNPSGIERDRPEATK